MRTASSTFTILITPAESLPGQWVAHCLNIDLVTQGNSIEHAFEMAREAVLLVVEDDLRNSLDPLDRPSAPPDCWASVQDIMQQGCPLSDVRDPGEIAAAIGMLRVTVPQDALPEHARPPEVEALPPAWQIASLRHAHTHTCHC